MEATGVRAHHLDDDRPRSHALIKDPLLEEASATELAALAEQHRLLVHNTDSGLILHDSAGVVVSANPAAEGLLGLGLEAMRGRSALDARWATVDEDGHPLTGR